MNQQGITRISVQEAAKLMAKGAVVVDVRDPASFQQGHMPAAVHLDSHNVSDFIQQADPDAPTIAVCYHGHASQSAAAYLNSQDFSCVYSMDGGFNHWQLVHPDKIERG